MLKSELLREVTKVVLIDSTEEYEAFKEFENDNKGYEDFEDYLRSEGLNCVDYYKEFKKDKHDDIWELTYKDSSGQYVCPVCGKHENHYDPELDGYTCGFYGAGCNYMADTYELLEAVSEMFESDKIIDIVLFVGKQKYDRYGERI
jgi:hypothetical protein